MSGGAYRRHVPRAVLDVGGTAADTRPMFSTIAVGTDGSETAGRAVEAAFDMARRFGATVVILTAYTADRSGSAWASSSATHAERVLADAEEAAAAQGLEHASAMSEGDPGQVLVALAERHNADVLVVGNVGMHRRVLGSVPNTVTHRASCSVFVVKTS
jgi:nucleotide-binding universal stress UspA family protein